MSDNELVDSTKEFEEALKHPTKDVYVLQLFVAGATLQSQRAIARIRKRCEHYLPKRYSLEVIDLNQQPQLAQLEQITAVPTLIRKFPLPVYRIIGDMAREGQILVGLGLKKKS